MRKLDLDLIVWVLLLVQDRRSEATEAVASNLPLVVHPLKAFQDRVVTHMGSAAAFTRKQPFTCAGEGVEFGQRFERLLGERDDVEFRIFIRSGECPSVRPRSRTLTTSPQ